MADGKHYLDTRKIMRKISKQIENFYAMLQSIGQNGEVVDGKIVVNAKQAKLAKAKLPVLELFGIEYELVGENCWLSSSKYPQIANAWVYLSKTQKSLFLLAHGVFMVEDDYVVALVEKLVNEIDLNLMHHVNYFKANNYTFSCDANFAMWSFSFKNKVSGFIVHFDIRKYRQIDYGIINHINFKTMLEDFNEFDESFQEFITTVCKQCNACSLCLKGNTNMNLFYKTVTHKDNECKLCPSFPQFDWHRMNDDLMKNVIKCIEYQEKYAKQ